MFEIQNNGPPLHITRLLYDVTMHQITSSLDYHYRGNSPYNSVNTDHEEQNMCTMMRYATNLGQ